RPPPNCHPRSQLPQRHTIIYSFFFNDTATTEIYTLSLHDALPIFEVGVADSPGGRGVGDLDAARAEVAPHGVGIGGFHRDVTQAVGARLGFRNQFDVLALVDLQEGQGQAAIRLVELERLFVSQQVLIEVARLLDIVNEEGDVGNSGDG